MTGRASDDVGAVFILDDEGVVRKSLSHLLRFSGYRVQTYGSAAESLLRGLCTEYGCLILDVRMLGLTGMELQDRLIELGNHLPIVFICYGPNAADPSRVW